MPFFVLFRFIIYIERKKVFVFKTCETFEFILASCHISKMLPIRTLSHNLVITNSSGLAELVRYNQGFIITGWIYVINESFGTKLIVCLYNQVIVITEFHCILMIFSSAFHWLPENLFLSKNCKTTFVCVSLALRQVGTIFLKWFKNYHEYLLLILFHPELE